MPFWRSTRRATKWLLALTLLLVVALVILRVMLPGMVRDYVNERLSSMEGYEGRVGDVDIHLWRGAYSIHQVRIVKTGGEVPVPLFASKKIDFSILWSALFRGAAVGEMYLEHPVINFVDAPTADQRQTGKDRPWTEVVQDLFPFRIDRLEVRDGEITFRNFHSDPPVDIAMTQVNAIATNLTNSRELSDTLTAKVDATGLAMGAGFEMQLDIDPYSERPTFDLNARLLELDVTRLDDLMKAYAGFDMEAGTFTLVTEIAAKEGRMEGYAKPLFKNLKVLTWGGDVEKDKDNPLQLFWEAIVGVVGGVFKNHEKDQLATRIPLRGDLEAPQTDLMAAIGGVMRNAFIQAFQPRLEGSVTLKPTGPKTSSKSK